jgi:TonB family protein
VIHEEALHPDVMKTRVQGLVELEFVVLADGAVGDVKVVKSLHPGLDQEAVKAVKQWRFKPGTKDGQPVAVLVAAEMTFTLGKRSGQPLLPTLPVSIPETPPAAAAGGRLQARRWRHRLGVPRWPLSRTPKGRFREVTVDAWCRPTHRGDVA